MLADLAGLPRTVVVTPTMRSAWEDGECCSSSRSAAMAAAVYRGDKVTKRVWAEIVRGGYVALDFAAPSERMIKLDGMPERRKTDVRFYTYEGRVLLTAARLYQGQATNLRTPGGGFAPVFAI
jgi:hypothetical protein